MIVNWKKEKAGVLVLPCMRDGKCIKKIHILPGHNDVPEDDWKLARNSAMRHIRNGNIVEVVKEVVYKVKKAMETPVKSTIVDADGALASEEVFPFKEISKVLKKLNLYDTIAEFKKEETGKKPLTKKWLLEYMKQEEETWEQVKTELYPDTEEGKDSDDEETEEITYATLMDLEPNEAEKVIMDTFNLDTLTKWKKEVSQPDLRVLIMNQIEEVDKVGKNK